MRVSYEWLKDMVDLPDDPADLVAALTRTGTEVEAVERVGADITKVVTSQVLERSLHPDSDHLYVCKMDVGPYNVDEEGNPTPLQVVCGAQNFRQGDKTVTALVGATLPGGVTIKKGKLRGVDSCGMNCSSRELGLGSDHAGIMILPADAPVGVDFVSWQKLSDTVIDCEITPNRPDCLSMAGMATEVAAVLDEDTHVELPRIARESAEFGRTADLVDVSIQDPSLCSRYAARVVRNVKIGPSPEWLARRIIAAGARPINNVVDVTNYVMFLTGQPLHAFDLGKLSERDGRRHVVVRAAADGERIVTLDGQTRTLTSDMVVITDDGHAPICLAGVMGSQNSEIDEGTVDVLLEAARFDAGHISRTSRNLTLMSEASIRFERQVDASACADVADVVAALFEACCSAQVCEGRVDEYPLVTKRVTIELRPDRVRALCGAPIETAFMASRLERLGCEVSRGADDTQALVVVAPSNRPDLTRDIDLVEEVLRLWGEGDVEPTLPAARNHAGGLTCEQRRLRQIGQVLRSCGLSETSTYNFADPDDLTRLGMGEQGRGVPVKILHPLVDNQSQMRRNLLAGLLRSVAYNRDHGVENVHLYEIGRVFFGHERRSQPTEPSYVAGVLSGSWGDDQWCAKHESLDFYDAKGVVETLLDALRVTKLRFRPADPATYGWLQPGRGAEVLAQGELIGWVGNVHPTALAAFDIDAPVVAFELAVAALQRLARRELPYEEVPTLPGVSIDLALVVDEAMSYEQLSQRIKSAGGKLLTDVRLFDVYRDPVRVGEGKKSMAFSLTYRAADHTLTSAEVDKAHERLIKKVMRSTGGEVRS
ncbi:phenylalanine--tRNA ligase subunit beta [Olsenella sp. HMSC062G07]|uniref:phenylalanine--tRNA ligase subunit beta n=1 Tax=Olsenella sp. HMSC062G07 TaxID=1739330 RepID=UPI0008A5DAE9|nr:phenylalanine--tRNA ligase subunit beta [Olsenella sp. HMSC062G07]OFK23430.1 phenylalanine--tRNA ligase subunit beta [Olsenella sp. HMSC062G07]